MISFFAEPVASPMGILVNEIDGPAGTCFRWHAELIAEEVATNASRRVSSKYRLLFGTVCVKPSLPGECTHTTESEYRRPTFTESHDSGNRSVRLTRRLK